MVQYFTPPVLRTIKREISRENLLEHEILLIIAAKFGQQCLLTRQNPY